ncbi:DUF397 domain-containing protein [Streptomyces sp. Tu 3180]|uniref:DUF397 domain-containing protein n=1 Tax=Streptomyces sp. Tu 3180 TaxID=2682611 RepID=UPI00135BC845|nr:DUF397 domain-containing protein [Streptomyces sp. Tu 3180]KAF3469818.1 DUF397 domain-containing protein [Streptomyces sp. Tu 3180]
MSSTDERARFKSSSSGSGGDACVEVAQGTQAIHVRDSEDRRSPGPALSPTAWSGFVAYAARDRPPRPPRAGSVRHGAGVVRLPRTRGTLTVNREGQRRRVRTPGRHGSRLYSPPASGALPW